jgi:hypothetical protein
MSYKFSADVKSIKPDGSAIIDYKRPTMTQIVDEPGADKADTDVEKLDWHVLLTVSPANELLAMKDLNPPKPKKNEAKVQPMVLNHMMAMRAAAGGGQILDALLGSLTDGLYGLLMFEGSIDSGFDFSPKLPFEDVVVGATWKRTVGYTPQKLKDKGEKMEMQRIDYTFSYAGIVDNGKQKVYRIHADVEINSDLGAFINQSSGLKPGQSALKSLPFKLKSKVDYDLDMKTRKTLKVVATSEASAQIFLSSYEDPYEEMKFKGRAVMKPITRKP